MLDSLRSGRSARFLRIVPSIFHSIVIACAGILIASSCALEPSQPQARHVVLITVDTLRADHLGCYGYPEGTSPNIDHLAASAVRFESALAPWPKTSPSVASMMSSSPARATGVRRVCGQRLPSDLTVLAEVLAAGGYATAAVVSNRFLGATFGFDRGFGSFHEVWHGVGRDDAEVVTSAAVEWLAQRPFDQPFFLWVHYLDPHAPYVPPAEFVDAPAEDGRSAAPEWIPFSGDDRDMGAIPIHAQIEGLHDLQGYIDRYDGEVRFVDSWIGRLLDRLDAEGVSDSTLVVFTADHGESLGDHNYFFEHGRLPYDACLRVPLLIRAPWIRGSGAVVSPPVGLVDVAPTILDAIGIEPPPEFFGGTLMPLLAEGVDGPSMPVFAGAGYTEQHQRVVRRGRWKLISIPDASDQAAMTGSGTELYDVEVDPGETENVAPDHPVIVSELLRELDRWLERVPHGPDAVTVSLPDDERAALESLGYVEESAAARQR